jgi:hypothetical protein
MKTGSSFAFTVIFFTRIAAFRLLDLFCQDVCVYSLARKKGEVVPLRSTEAHLGDRRYSSYSFLTSALKGGEWSASRPGRALLPGKEPPVPIVQEAVWAPEPVWTQRLEEKPGRPVRSQPLYWLGYPGSPYLYVDMSKIWQTSGTKFSKQLPMDQFGANMDCCAAFVPSVRSVGQETRRVDTEYVN